MDLDVEVQNNSLDLWLENCMLNVDGAQNESENSLLTQEIESNIPEISESDVTSEIEKLTADDIGLTSDSAIEVKEDLETKNKVNFMPECEESEQTIEEEYRPNKINISKQQKDTMDSAATAKDKDAETPPKYANQNSEGVHTNGEKDNNIGKDYDNGDGHESGVDHDSGTDHESGAEHDSGDEANLNSGDDYNIDNEEPESEYDESQLQNDDEDPENEDNLGLEDHESGDDGSSQISGSSAAHSPKLIEARSIKTEKLVEDHYADDNASILEPTCELAEPDEYEGLKSRFNLRKRNHIQAPNEEDFGSDDYDPELEGVPNKKLKFNFSKKNYRRQRPYTNEAVKEAVKLVQSKKMSILEASRQYDIPRTSLHNFVRLYKRGRRMGVRTLSPGLTKQEEEEMVSLVIKLSRCGKRYSHNELRFLIQYYLINNDRPVFKSGTLPTMGWIAGLVERQPELTRAKSKKNTKVAAEDVEEWQKQIEDYLVNDWDLDIGDIFRYENGNRIYCFNAFKMTLNGPSENSENKPSPVKKEPGTEDEKDQEVSAILGMSADGGFVVPTIVICEDNMDVCPPCDPKCLKVMFNRTGRVDEEVAIKMIRDFDDEIVSKGIPKPVVFFVNDKQDLAHFSVIEYCWENQIVIICLPPKTCKTMTPFEVSIWPKIRSSYATLWKNSPKNYDSKLTIDKFPELFLKAWESAAIVKQAVRGFTKSGLIPLDVPAILGDPVSSGGLGGGFPEPVMEDSESQMAVQEMDDSIPEELSSLEDRSRGKLEGIQMCLEAIEAFIPPDVIPVWNERGADYRGRCELGFKLWRSVSLLLKAGCAMASIQRMADGFFNPFGGGGDFPSPANFFQKTPLDDDSAPESRVQPLQNPIASLGSPAPPPPVSAEKPPMPKKRKLNKSIYSKSAASLVNNGGVEEEGSEPPFVKMYQNPYMMAEEEELEED